MNLRLSKQRWTPAETKKIFFRFELDLTEGIFEQIAKTIEKCRAKVLVIDPLFGIASRQLDLNKAGAMSEVMRKFKAIARKLDVAVLIVHHSRKASRWSPGGNLDDDASGSAAIVALSDVRAMIHNAAKILDTKILISGKDREFEQFSVAFDPATCTWARVEVQSLESRVVAALKEAKRVTATGLAHVLHEERSGITRTLIGLYKQGRVTRERVNKETFYGWKG